MSKFRQNGELCYFILTGMFVILRYKIKTHYDIDALLAFSVSETRDELLKKRLLSSLYQEKITSFNTRNKKLKGLMSKNKSAESNYSTP